MLNSIAQFVCLAAMVGAPFYFRYWLHNHREAKPKDINALVTKISLFELVLLFLSTFLSTAQKTSPQALIFAGAAFFSIVFLYQSRKPIEPKARIFQSLRSFLALSLFISLNFIVTQTLTPITGVFVAVAVAIVLLVGAAPLFVRVLYSTRPLHPSPLKNEILVLFEKAGVSLGEIYLMDTDQLKVSNALVCGSKFGFGPFRRSLFVTINLFEILNEDEIKAVLCHEASHFKLHHVAKRGLAAFICFFLALILVNLPMMALAISMQGLSSWLTPMMVLSVVANFIFQFAFMFRVIRKHEFEADLNAVVLGATPNALVSALEKVTDFNGGSKETEDRLTRFFMGSGHPSLEERKEAILNHRMPQTVALIPPPRYIAAYVAIIAVIGTAFYRHVEQNPSNQASRAIASESNR